jgi:5-methylcytosine-specific restriction enzyme A
MQVRDLPDPVTASKADWLPGTTWIGFTPQGRGPGAEAQCQATVKRQFGNGYVIERVTQSFGVPNPAFADDPLMKEDRERHDKLRDRLVAVHRLRPSARPLVEIIGQTEFDRLQASGRRLVNGGAGPWPFRSWRRTRS